MRHRRFLLILALFLWPAEVRAQSHEGWALAPLFPKRADIALPPGEGTVRLRLTPELQQELAPEYAALRVVDGGGHEVDWVIGSALSPLDAREESARSVAAEVLDLEQEKDKHAPKERRRRETFEVITPSGPSPSGGWELVFDAAADTFYRDARIDGDDGSVIALAPVFRLREPYREALRVPIPEPMPRRLRIRLDGASPELEPKVHFEAARAPNESRFVLELHDLRTRHADGRTVVEMDRPRGLLPQWLRLTTSTESFHRRVIVRAVGGAAGAGMVVAEGELFRSDQPVECERVALPLARAFGDRLEVEMDDEGQLALASLGFSMEIDEPAVLFVGEKGDHGLYAGGGRARAPHELSKLPAGSGARLATLGTLRANPSYADGPALAVLAQAGALIDPRSFSHERPLLVASMPEGVARYRLDASDLAHARADLGDLRVVDENWRQWPYLLQSGVTRELRLEAASVERRDGRSYHHIALPEGAVEVVSLALAIDADYIDRRYELRGRDGDEWVQLGGGRLQRRPPESDDLALAIPKPRRIDALELMIDDGGDAPLELADVQADIATTDVYLAAVPGSYRLLIGDPDAEAPRYELSSARELVLAVADNPIEAQALVPNDRHVPRQTKSSHENILWGVLIAAVVVLAGLTLHAARIDERRLDPTR